MENLFDLPGFQVRPTQVNLAVKLGKLTADDPIQFIDLPTATGKSHTVKVVSSGVAQGILPDVLPTFKKKVVIVIPDDTIASIYCSELKNTYGTSAKLSFPPNSITKICVITHQAFKELWNKAEQEKQFEDCVIFVDEGHVLFEPESAAEAIKGLRTIRAQKPRAMVLFSGSWSTNFRLQLLPQIKEKASGFVDFVTTKSKPNVECKLVHIQVPALQPR